MTFRIQMQVSPSNAEIETLIELSKRGLLRYMDNLGTTLLFMGADKYIKASKERVTRQLVANSLDMTIPDFCFLRQHNFPMYLDGPPHLRPRIRERDERHDRFSRSCKLDPVRFPFKNWSKTRKIEVVDSIEAKLT